MVRLLDHPLANSLTDLKDLPTSFCPIYGGMSVGLKDSSAVASAQHRHAPLGKAVVAAVVRK
jgi:hypothetical protein